MKYTFKLEREALVRKLSIRLETTPEKAISAVDARYDGLPLRRDDLDAAVTTFERTYRKDQANAPGRHELLITAESPDGTSESFASIWDE